MEENQTNQNNLNQQPVQAQSEQVQSNVDQASVSMQIQELLVKQQQYQQQYNQLVEYVKNTPNLPIEQVNEVKQQLDQLNALFVEGKQKLQALWYTQVQVNKPAEVKKWSKINLSFKKLAIWCLIILVLLLTWLFLALFSLIKNPNALLWFGFRASTAKSLLMVFFGLLLWSLIILMIWVIVSNIYRLITVKNQSKWKFVLGLIWWIFGIWILWALLWVVFTLINKINTEPQERSSYLIEPYLLGLFDNSWNRARVPYDNSNPKYDYPLIAPAEVWFRVIGSDILNELWNSKKIDAVELICWNKQWQRLEISTVDLDLVRNGGDAWFEWSCLYWEKWKYSYSLEVTYTNTLTQEKNRRTTISVNKDKALNFDSEMQITSSNNKTSRKYPTDWEFILWPAPASITVDTTQIFRDFKLTWYNVIWDMDWDKKTDRENQVTFNYSYKRPQVYYPSVKFLDLAAKYPLVTSEFGFIYTFPVRVEQSDNPVCEVIVTDFQWTTKYQISTDFVDASSAATISSYRYTIQNVWTKKTIEVLEDYPQEFSYTFPEEWNYVVILDYVTVDKKQWQCESDVVQMGKEKFNISYTLLSKDAESSKFKELCNSNSSAYSKCKEINLDEVPKTYQLQIKSVIPYSNTTKKAVLLNEKPILNDNDTYTFDIPDEWIYTLTITASDASRWMEEETIEIKFTAKKPNIIGNMTVISNETRLPVSEWFEPLTVILDASKTEINVPWDEIIYFTWDFGDWEIKRNQQNWIVAHTYNFDYARENWIFQPKVTITTKEWLTDVILWPKINVKKWLINVELLSVSHPSRQAGVWKDVTFSAEFDWLPEKMIRDFGDGTPIYTCQWRTCTEVVHAYKEAWLYSVKLSLEFDAVQQVDGTMDFKVY